MTEGVKKISIKVGLPPGTLVHIGKKKSEKVRIRIIEFNEEQYRERELSTIDEYLPSPHESLITWMNIDGLHRNDVMEKIGGLFHLHPLTLEDIVTTGQSPRWRIIRIISLSS
jgi:magnesium transporter